MGLTINLEGSEDRFKQVSYSPPTYYGFFLRLKITPSYFCVS
jgi:hypothetical protein